MKEVCLRSPTLSPRVWYAWRCMLITGRWLTSVHAVIGTLALFRGCIYHCELSRLEAEFRPRSAVPTTRWRSNPVSAVVLWEYVSRGCHTFNK